MSTFCPFKDAVLSFLHVQHAFFVHAGWLLGNLRQLPRVKTHDAAASFSSILSWTQPFLTYNQMCDHTMTVPMQVHDSAGSLAKITEHVRIILIY